MVATTLRFGIMLTRAFSNPKKGQVRCVRAMRGLEPIESCVPIFISLRILSLPSSYVYFRNMYLLKTNLNYFIKLSDVRTTPINTVLQFIVNMCYNIALVGKSVDEMASKSYNKPAEIRFSAR